jgi:hypothetical protein
MTCAQQREWDRVARAAAVASAAGPATSFREASVGLCRATAYALRCGLAFSEVAEALCAGWSGLAWADAILFVEDYLERQAPVERDRLHWTLADLVTG